MHSLCLCVSVVMGLCSFRILPQLPILHQQLPPGPRDTFIAHELDGMSFKEIAASSGVNMNTLLARKRYAVLHLRARLQMIREEFDL